MVRSRLQQVELFLFIHLISYTIITDSEADSPPPYNDVPVETTQNSENPPPYSINLPPYPNDDRQMEVPSASISRFDDLIQVRPPPPPYEHGEEFRTIDGVLRGRSVPDVLPLGYGRVVLPVIVQRPGDEHCKTCDCQIFTASMSLICNPVFGLVGIILAKIATRHAAVGELQSARRLSFASVVTSLIGIVASVIIISLVCGIKLSDNESSPQATVAVVIGSTTVPGLKPSCDQFSVYDMCFASRNLSMFEHCDADKVCYGSCRYCCRPEDVYYLYSCYSDLVTSETAHIPSHSCPYKAYGRCFSRRYYHGSCTFDKCCPKNSSMDTVMFDEDWCYYRSTTTATTAPDANCVYNVGGVCYGNKKAWSYGPCPYSACCAVDETYYNNYCYYNTGDSRTMVSDPPVYRIDTFNYAGRYYSGSCQSGVSCCMFEWDRYYEGHCYYR